MIVLRLRAMWALVTSHMYDGRPSSLATGLQHCFARLCNPSGCDFWVLNERSTKEIPVILVVGLGLGLLSFLYNYMCCFQSHPRVLNLSQYNFNRISPTYCICQKKYQRQRAVVVIRTP